VLAGNNEDYLSGPYDTALFIVPPEGGFHGYVLVGYSLFDGRATFSSQGGVNDQGLFTDGNAAPLLEARTNAQGDRFAALSTFAGLLKTCGTVSEALDTLATWDLTGIIERAKIFLADRSGDAAIYEGDWITRKSGAYLISTNFYESHPELGGFPCWRYQAIEQLLQGGTPLSLDFFAQVAEAAHQGASTSDPAFTHYTNLHDLQTNRFRLFYRLDYLRFLSFDLAEEFASGGGLYLMSDLFGPKVTAQQGAVGFHLESFYPPAKVPLLVRDAGLNRDPAAREQVEVLVTSRTEPGGERITLTEILPDQGVFTGLVAADSGPPVAGDRKIQVSAQDVLTALYQDADDGSGQPAEASARAQVFCDLDQDGQDAAHCGGGDCNDLAPAVAPGATEFCDLQDNDCDGRTDPACTDCAPGQEPDITANPEELDPNPLACGTCARGDFSEPEVGDDGAYRVWADVFRIDARAGETLVASARREQPDGIFRQVLYDPASQPVAEDSGLGLIRYQVPQDGAYLLALGLARVDHAVEPNAYTLALLCPAAPVFDGGDGGPDGGPDGESGGDGGPDGGVSPGGDSFGCGCGAGDTTGGWGLAALAYLIGRRWRSSVRSLHSL
jgi:MYXO-CTERM domain-containing protein